MKIKTDLFMEKPIVKIYLKMKIMTCLKHDIYTLYHFLGNFSNLKSFEIYSALLLYLEQKMKNYGLFKI